MYNQAALRLCCCTSTLTSPRPALLRRTHRSTIGRRTPQRHVSTMQFKPLSLAALLCAYMSTALAADAGLPASCNVKNAGKACKKCIFNDNTLVDVCYRGVCGVITRSNKRASGISPRRACERRGDNADDGVNFRNTGRVFVTLIFRLGYSLG
jgi:hypothetical protein